MHPYYHFLYVFIVPCLYSQVKSDILKSSYNASGSVVQWGEILQDIYYKTQEKSF